MANKLASIGIFAAGAGIGAAVALLYAPRSGRHTRARLRNSANRTIHRVEEIRNDIQSRLAEAADEVSETLASHLACGADARISGESVQQVLDKVRERLNAGRERVEEYVRSAAR
jgi:gas vesicle protein